MPAFFRLFAIQERPLFPGSSRLYGEINELQTDRSLKTYNYIETTSVYKIIRYNSTLQVPWYDKSYNIVELAAGRGTII